MSICRSDVLLLVMVYVLYDNRWCYIGQGGWIGVRLLTSEVHAEANDHRPMLLHIHVPVSHISRPSLSTRHSTPSNKYLITAYHVVKHRFHLNGSSFIHQQPTMHFTSLISTLFISAAAVVSASQVDVVINDITALDKDVQSLTANVRAYNGGLIPQIPQLFGLTQVHLATRKGYYDSKTLPSPLSETDATRLIQHVNETLSVDNPIAVEVLISKKEFFDKAGTSLVIKEGLKILLKDHLDFSYEVLERAPADQLAEGNEVVDVITNALQHGIATFST